MHNWHKVFKPKWLIEVLKNVPESLSAWIVLQNKVFINQEQSVLAKQGVKMSLSPHSSSQQH